MEVDADAPKAGRPIAMMFMLSLYRCWAFLLNHACVDDYVLDREVCWKSLSRIFVCTSAVDGKDKIGASCTMFQGSIKDI